MKAPAEALVESTVEPVEAPQKTVQPFTLRFAEVQDETLLHKGLEEYDDPTTVDTTGEYEDPHTDSD